MYKTQSQNMLSRSFRAAQRAKLNRVKMKDSPSVVAFRKSKRQKEILATEKNLIGSLGEGPEFVLAIFDSFQEQFSKHNFDVKRCSAFLNLIAGSRMRDGALWSDQAIKSMFRRVRDNKTRK